MKVLFINHEYPPLGGGAANATYYIAREVVRLGHQVTVVTSGYSDLPQEEQTDGAHLIRLPVGRKHRSHATLREAGQYVLRAVPFVRSLCRKKHFDIIQVFFALPNGPIGLAASQASRAPFFIRLAGGDLPGFDDTRHPFIHGALTPLLRYILRHAQAVVANSEGLQRRALDLVPGLKCTVIHNGIDLEEFQPAQAHNHPPTLLFVSRLIERKGLQFLLPALADLRDKGVPFHLQIVGDGPYEPTVRQLIAETNLGDWVTLRGYIPHDHLPPIYAAADVFVLPSLNEGMANVMLEALASGLPIVATDVPGTKEIVVDQLNGRIVPPMSAEALKESLFELLTDSNKRHQMARQSRKCAEQFGWASIALQYVGLWQAT